MSSYSLSLLYNGSSLSMLLSDSTTLILHYSPSLLPQAAVPFGENAHEKQDLNQRSCKSRSSYKWHGSFRHPVGAVYARQ